jgi:two-component system OmpR family sensor kinase
VVDDCAKQLGGPERLHYVKPDGATLVAPMDMDAFATVVRNLIDNAANHGAAGGRIEVQLEPEGVIRITNDGPVVRAQTLAGLKRRFVRGETTSAGAGLGLAITETIINQTGGRLDLLSPAPGRDQGFEAR